MAVRDLKFILSAVAILLAGALAAGFAARAVTAPRTGETLSAGTVSVPSVLGRTADEVLFYPWSWYDIEQKSNLAEQASAELGDYVLTLVADPLALLGVRGVEAEGEALWAAVEGNEGGDHVYLRDFPCTMEDGTQVEVSWAVGTGRPQAYSLVLRPAERQELSQQQQEVALERVREDLRKFLCGDDSPDGLADRLMDLRTILVNCGGGEVVYPINGLFRSRAEWWWQTEELKIGEADEEAEEVGERSLEEMIRELEATFAWTVQLIAAPSQVVILFSAGDMVIGVYYDIQLERYSGFGLSG